jgi:Phospholipid methyltransferase
MKTLFIAFRAAIFGSGFIFLWGWVALSLHQRYDGGIGFALPGWTRAVGMALMVGGGTLAFACVATFVTRGEGTPAPFDPPRKFVAAGPYKLVRNPMYAGGFIALCRGSCALTCLSCCTRNRICGLRFARRTRLIAAWSGAGCRSVLGRCRLRLRWVGVGRTEEGDSGAWVGLVAPTESCLPGLWWAQTLRCTSG